MAKYAKKYASVRTAIAKLKGVTNEIVENNVVVPVRETKAEEVKQEVVETVQEVEAKPVIVDEQKVEPVVKKKASKFKRARKPSKKK